MIIKILGCIIIVFSSFRIGILYVKNLKSEIDTTQIFIDLFEIIKIKLEYQQMPVLELFNDILQYDNKSYCFFVNECKNQILSGKTLKESITYSIELFSSKTKINKEVKTIIKKISTEFGNTDLNGQLSLICCYIEQLKKVKKEQEKEYESKNKLALNLSVYSGIALSILLI